MPSSGLTGVAEAHLEQWRLRVDGAFVTATRSVVVPVRTEEGIAAILKVAAAEPDTEHEHLVLRRWAGDGAVRLLRANPHERVVLLERATGPSLESLPDTRGCEIIAALYDRLHVPALPQLDSLTAQTRQWADELEQLPRGAPLPRRLVEQSVTLCRELTADAAATEVVLHGNLHFGNIVGAQREPWLAISPRPLNGDQHFELAPVLWHRWDALEGNIRDGVRHRFYTVVDAAGLDEDLARAWTLIRVIHTASRELRSGATSLTRYVAVAKAVQD